MPGTQLTLSLCLTNPINNQIFEVVVLKTLRLPHKIYVEEIELNRHTTRMKIRGSVVS